MAKPATPIVLGSGQLAESVRAQIVADPDRYRPATYSIDPIGVCPCCEREVFRARSRYTNFENGFVTFLAEGEVLHQQPGKDGVLEARCCCATEVPCSPDKAKPAKAPRRKKKA